MKKFLCSKTRALSFTVPLFLGAGSVATQASADNGQGAYTDVIYSLVGTFSIQGTTFGMGDQSFANLSYRNSNPSWGSSGGSGEISPFDTPAGGTSSYSQAFVRLRYANQNNQCATPQQTTGAIVEWYFPLDFQQTNGATVNVDVDHSAGLIDQTLSNCGSGDIPCQNHAPALSSNLQALNQGNFVGSTLQWGNCSPPPSGDDYWNFANARQATGSGCVSYNSFGNVNTSSSLVPSSGKGDSYQTWNQQFQPFVFNSSDPFSATFTMAPMQIPNATGESNTWLAITSTNILTSICVDM